MLSKSKLNDMYWAGYCDATIARGAATKPGAAGRRDREEWMKSHIPCCEQCTKATIVKSLEYETAARMGGTAKALFQNGGDVRALPGFTSGLKYTLNRAAEAGIVTPKFYEWLSEQATKYGKDWPGLAEVETSPPS